MRPAVQEFRDKGGNPPLTLPRELWTTLSREHQAACRSAQSLLNVLDVDRSVLLRDMFARADLGVEQTLAGLRVLDGMSLVSIDATRDGPRIDLVARPEEHVRVVGPDGQVRWLFVSRPLEAPALDPASLN